MPKELLLEGSRNLKLGQYDDSPLKPDEVRAVAITSGISHGTELNLYRGTAPFHNKRFDPDLRLFVETAEQEPYPRRLGYEWMGRVSEVGKGVKDFRVGDLVHLPFPHRETHTFVAGGRTSLGPLRPLPAGFEAERAVVIALAGVALQAVHDAHIKAGDRVAVFGLGAVGLLAMQIARLNGAPWVDAVDPIAARRSLAEKLGASRTLNPDASDVGLEIKTASPEKGADVAIEVSGHYPALHQAIRSVRMGGRVVAAGYYQGGGTALRLGEEWHHNRITMVSSMGVWECPHRDYPLWDRGRIHETAIDLLATGKLRTDGFITHRIPFERAAEAYELIDQRPQEVIKVVLTY